METFSKYLLFFTKKTFKNLSVIIIIYVMNYDVILIKYKNRVFTIRNGCKFVMRRKKLILLP